MQDSTVFGWTDYLSFLNAQLLLLVYRHAPGLAFVLVFTVIKTGRLSVTLKTELVFWTKFKY